MQQSLEEIGACSLPQEAQSQVMPPGSTLLQVSIRTAKLA